MKSEKELFQDVIDARNECDRIEGQLKEAKARKEEVEGLLIERMDAKDLKSFRVEGLGNIIRKQMLYPSVEKSDQEALIAYVDEELGKNYAVKRTIHSATLRSIITEELSEGRSVPEFIRLYFKPGLTITK